MRTQGNARDLEGSGHARRRRPRVTVNVAMSLDGRIAGTGGRRVVFSDAQDQRRVHELRATHDAILVGVGTVLTDDPCLTVRKQWVPGARDPLRVVLEGRRRTPVEAQVVDDTASSRVYCLGPPPKGMEHKGTVFVQMDPAPDGDVDLAAVLEDLWGLGVRSLMVEGGSRVISSFLDQGLVDELFVFVAPVVVGEGAPGLVSQQAKQEGTLAGFKVVECEDRPSGVLLRLAPDPS